MPEEAIRRLVGTVGHPIDIQEVVDIYLPLIEFLGVLAEIRKSAQQKVGAFSERSATRCLSSSGSREGWLSEKPRRPGSFRNSFVAPEKNAQ